MAVTDKRQLEQKLTVVSIQGEQLQLQPYKPCRGCNAQFCCQTLFRKKQFSVSRSLLPETIQVGQHVLLTVTDAYLTSASLLLYGLPLLGLLAGFVLADLFALPPIGALMLVLGSSALSVFSARQLSQRLSLGPVQFRLLE